MTDRRCHLGWFVHFGAQSWNAPLGAAPEPWNGNLHLDLARAMERACFDYMLIEDTLSIPSVYGASSDTYLRRGIMAPKHDPAPLAGILGHETRHLGIVTTLSTAFYPPFMLARLASTLDHLTAGRFGWNIVTSTEDAAARNFGLVEMPPRALRYEMADEYVELVRRLFDSWEPGAVVRDHATDTYVDPARVHAVNFVGKYFRAEGPLNTVRSPQGRPAFIQAGGSPRGRQFAGRHADSIIATTHGIAGMRAYRADVRAHAEAAGRDPDDVKVLFLVAPYVADTMDDARSQYDRLVGSAEFSERTLAAFGSFMDIDFSRYDLDEPLPPLTTNGEQGALDRFTQTGLGQASHRKTLRELVREAGTSSSLELVGTPDHVAGLMGEAMEAVGGDGFLITHPFGGLTRHYIAGITEGLVPALQRRGLARTAYTTRTLRETLREF